MIVTFPDFSLDQRKITTLLQDALNSFAENSQALHSQFKLNIQNKQSSLKNFAERINNVRNKIEQIALNKKAANKLSTMAVFPAKYQFHLGDLRQLPESSSYGTRLGSTSNKINYSQRQNEISQYYRHKYVELAQLNKKNKSRPIQVKMQLREIDQLVYHDTNKHVFIQKRLHFEQLEVQKPKKTQLTKEEDNMQINKVQINKYQRTEVNFKPIQGEAPTIQFQSQLDLDGVISLDFGDLPQFNVIQNVKRNQVKEQPIKAKEAQPKQVYSQTVPTLNQNFRINGDLEQNRNIKTLAPPSGVLSPPSLLGSPPSLGPPPSLLGSPPSLGPPPSLLGSPPSLGPPPSLLGSPPSLGPPPSLLSSPPTLGQPPSLGLPPSLNQIPTLGAPQQGNERPPQQGGRSQLLRDIEARKFKLKPVKTKQTPAIMKKEQNSESQQQKPSSSGNSIFDEMREALARKKRQRQIERRVKKSSDNQDD